VTITRAYLESLGVMTKSPVSCHTDQGVKISRAA
jgi:hypothetical protein